MAEKKKFGLIMSKKADALKIKKLSVFNDSSDEDERVQKRPKVPQKKIESKSKLKTDSVDDPSIYEYDDIYEDMKRKQMETIPPKEKQNSRYIETLLKAAEKRKKEYERRLDKKIQTEREKEGDKFKDKEAFVTSSYKRRMLEQEEEEEKERRENMLNDMMDVTKQNDLSGFYRHFLKQTVGEEKVPRFGGREVKEEVVSDVEASHKRKKIDQDSDDIELDNKNPKCDAENRRKSSDSKSEFSDNEQKPFHFKKQVRMHYRKSSKSLSLNSSSSEDEDVLHADRNVHSTKKSNKSNTISFHSSSDSDGHLSEKPVDNKEDYDKNGKRFSIFAKRTIGDTFANAQARYFQRMASQKSKI